MLDDIRKIPKDRFPHHIFIIPDGNGRWAKMNKKPVSYGHQKGDEVMEKILRDLSVLDNLDIVTVWGFSSDNWKRSNHEVNFLMRLFDKTIKDLKEEFLSKDIRFIHIGRKDRLPRYLKESIDKVEKITYNNKGKIICLAIDFGGDDQDLRIINRIIEMKLKDKIDLSFMYKLRDGEGLIPPADLIIRTSGEMRTSDVGWLNGAPTELCFINKFFPDISSEDVYSAIIDFSQRERRFGSRK